MGIDMERKGEIVGDLDWDGLHRPRIYYAMVATFSAWLFLPLARCFAPLRRRCLCWLWPVSFKE